MSLRSWSAVGLCAVVFLIAWKMWQSNTEWQPANEFVRAEFTRPTVLPTQPNGFKIQVAGVDGLNGVPTVERGVNVEIVITLPDANSGDPDFLIVVPRLKSQGVDGFEWMYPPCDVGLGLNSNGRKKGDRRTYHVKAKFQLRPGEYNVRYYSKTLEYDEENGPPEEVIFGEGSLIVTESKSGLAGEGLVPLEDERCRIPLFRPRSENP